MVVMCFYDGFRERTQYNRSGKLEMYTPRPDEFRLATEIYLPRKVPRFGNGAQCKVLAYSGHANDPNVILVPDKYFTDRNGYADIKQKIDAHWVKWADKQNKAVFRGTEGNGSVHNFFDADARIAGRNWENQRGYIYNALYPTMSDVLNADKNEPLDQLGMIKYKYILNVDGYASTYDATVWMMYSGSVMIKHKSVWKQWYYDPLQPWVHYVPCENDFSDLRDKIRWCMAHDAECQQIANNAREFVVTNLTWDRVMEDSSTDVARAVLTSRCVA